MAQLTKERQSSIDAAPVIARSSDDDDRSYGRAVALGSVVGILAWGAVVFAVLRVFQPDLGTGPTLGIATWVGIWTGLFLGGTITVGLWSNEHH